MSTVTGGIDRSKFKKTSVSQLAQSDKDLNKSLGRREKGSQNGHDVDEGSNLFRAYPVHPDISEKDDKATFTHPYVQTFLPAMVEEKKDGKTVMGADGKPKMKLSVRPVYNAIIHGKKAKDLVDEYIKLANVWAKENIKDDDQRRSFLEPIYGNYGKKINGITYPPKWVMYADKYPNGNPAANPVFDKLFFKKSIKDRLNTLSQMEAKNDPLGTDPFTDLEEGRAFTVFYNKDADAKSMYTTEFDSTTTKEILQGGRSVNVPKQYPLSDAQLTTFLDSKPLQELYGNCAGRKNFEAQLTGIDMFDSKNNMNIVSLPEWEKIVMELDSYYPENDTTGNPEDENAGGVVADENPVDENADEFELMNRAELSTYCKENKTGILPKPAMSDEDIRVKLRLWLAGSTIESKPLPGEPGYVEEKAEEIKEEPKAAETADEFLKDMNEPVVKETPQQKLERLRNKNKAQ